MLGIVCYVTAFHLRQPAPYAGQVNANPGVGWRTIDVS